MTDIPDISGLLQQGDNLHLSKGVVLTLLDKTLIAAEMTARKRYRNDLSKARHDLGKVINTIRELQGDIDDMYEQIGIDVSEIDDYRWRVIKGEIDSASGFPTDPIVLDPQ